MTPYSGWIKIDCEIKVPPELRGVSDKSSYGATVSWSNQWAYGKTPQKWILESRTSNKGIYTTNNTAENVVM